MAILSKYGVPYALAEMPKTMRVAIPLIGLQEVVGKGSNKTILKFRDELNAGFGVDPNAQKIEGYSDDDIPWCGLVQGWIWFTAGKPCVAAPLWARNWAKAGEPVAERINGKLVSYKDRKPSFGDTLVFVRDGGGHVGQYVCEDATHFGVLGGNQSNSFSIMRLEKSRCIAVRRPPMTVAPPSVHPIVVARVPAKTSLNEG
jgi:uncharacterized protein (TIGR02594 family)